MYTGKVLAWNKLNGRGLIECNLDGQVYKFESDDIQHTTDIMDMKDGINVFFTTEADWAHDVEIVYSSFNRFRDENPCDCTKGGKCEDKE
jgi:hypothetical protein